jgi:hypothetical protein
MEAQHNMNKTCGRRGRKNDKQTGEEQRLNMRKKTPATQYLSAQMSALPQHWKYYSLSLSPKKGEGDQLINSFRF